MRLKKAQKEKVLEWVAAGLQTDEINSRASEFSPPFNVSRQQVDYYRQTRELDLRAIRSISERTSLTEGYALKEHRVYKLSILAALMEKDNPFFQPASQSARRSSKPKRPSMPPI